MRFTYSGHTRPGTSDAEEETQTEWVPSDESDDGSDSASDGHDAAPRQPKRGRALEVSCCMPM